MMGTSACTAVVGSSAAVEAIMALYHQTVREAESSTPVVATPHVPQEVGSSAAVPTNMNVACDERRSVGKETKKTIQPGFQMNNAEIEANLVDWSLENASSGDEGYIDEWEMCGRCGCELPSHWDYCNNCGSLI